MSDYINSCFNYTGNKFKQLPQLLNIFPRHVGTFVDLFGGGGTIGINALKRLSPQHVIINDKSKPLIDIFKYLKNNTYQDVYAQIEEIIDAYSLSNTAKHSYVYYGVDSSKGLGKVNKAGFLKLRDDYNYSAFNSKYDKSLILYVLILFSFNNQIRFNKSGAFNLPVGKRDFNKNMQKKLQTFMDAIRDPRLEFTNKDFTQVDVPDNAFVYCDPPYSIADASYNERNLWTTADDLRLFNYLDNLNQRKIQFALSDVETHHGIENKNLIQWAQKYKTHKIDFSYKNSNYHSKAKKFVTKEVVITNF